MNLKHFSLCILLLVATFSCDRDTDDDPINKIKGTYTLISYDCCLLTSEQYEASQIIFDFDGISTVNISFSIAIDPDSQLPIKTAGIYEYTEVSNLLILNGIEYEFTLIGNQLTLFDDPELDGSITVFKQFTIADE